MLGRSVCRAASSAGAQVQPTSREQVPGWIRFDAIRDPPDRLFDAGAAAVVNCAAVLDSEIAAGGSEALRRAEAVNSRFPHRLAEAAARAGARVVHISTDAVFPADAGPCDEDTAPGPDTAYGATKHRGEPTLANAVTIRTSFVGRDPLRRRGLLEWLLAQPVGTTIPGFTDQLWNGLVVTQLARACTALLDAEEFRRARAEGPIHHAFEDPPLTKCELLGLIARTFGIPVSIEPVESERPVTRVLATRHSAVADYLESGPARRAALIQLTEETDG
jgi:dTDP-4-dehydrorhamnose reductase